MVKTENLTMSMMTVPAQHMLVAPGLPPVPTSDSSPSPTPYCLTSIPPDHSPLYGDCSRAGGAQPGLTAPQQKNGPYGAFQAHENVTSHHIGAITPPHAPTTHPDSTNPIRDTLNIYHQYCVVGVVRGTKVFIHSISSPYCYDTQNNYIL